MYINQLSQEKQDFIRQRLQSILQAEGLKDTELAEAVQNGLDSKVGDLGDILRYEEIQRLKTEGNDNLYAHRIN